MHWIADSVRRNDTVDPHRRTFLRGATGLALAALGGSARGSRPPVETFFTWQPLGAGAWSAQARGFGGASLLIAGSERALLVDTGKAPVGEALRREAWDLCALPIDVVNTHHHSEQTGGNHAFTTDRSVMAHTRATPRVLSQLNLYIAQSKDAVAALSLLEDGPAVDAVRKEARAYYARVHSIKVFEFCPTSTIEARTEEELGGVRVEIRPIGPAHTDNDLVVLAPERRIAHVGDLVSPGVHPYFDAEGGADIDGWVRALATLRGWCPEGWTLVSGDGARFGSEEIAAQEAYFVTLRRAVDEAVRAGKTRREVVALVPEGVGGRTGPTNLVVTLGALFDLHRR